jgi:hypothetical protein
VVSSVTELQSEQPVLEVKAEATEAPTNKTLPETVLVVETPDAQEVQTATEPETATLPATEQSE